MKGAVLEDDGGIWIAEEQRLAYFDSLHGAPNLMGRVGDGPEEFRRITGMTEWGGDSVVVLDGRLARLAWAHRGQIVRSQRVDVTHGRNMEGVWRWRPDSLVVGTAWSGAMLGSDRSEGLKRMLYPVLVYAFDGQLHSTLGPFAGKPMLLATGGGVLRTTEAPFSPTLRLGVAHGRLFIADGERYEVQVLGTEGEVTDIFKIEAPRRSVTAEDVARWLGERSESGRGPMEAVLNNVGVPDSMPAFTEMVVSAQGAVWLGERIVGSRLVAWHVVSGTTGAYCGTVHAPTGYTILALDATRIVGVMRDEIGREFVDVYALPQDAALC